MGMQWTKGDKKESSSLFVLSVPMEKSDSFFIDDVDF